MSDAIATADEIALALLVLLPAGNMRRFRTFATVLGVGLVLLSSVTLAAAAH